MIELIETGDANLLRGRVLIEIPETQHANRLASRVQTKTVKTRPAKDSNPNPSPIFT